MNRLGRITVATLLLALGGCGFHLRQPMPLPAVMNRIQVQVRDVHGRLANELRDQLMQSGAEVLPPEEGPESVLQVTGEKQEQLVASVDSQGKVTQYELRYTLEATLRQPGGAALLPPQSVVVKKMLDSDPTNVLGTTNEAEQLQADMLRDAVRQMLRQMRTSLVHRPTAP